MAPEAVCSELRCPITGELFVEPVIFIDDNITYERAAILQFLSSLPPSLGENVGRAVQYPGVPRPGAF